MKKERYIKILFVFLIFLGLGIVNNVSEVNAAVVGQQVLTPESGWRRYVNTASNFSYQGEWYYGAQYHDYYTGNPASRLKFEFYGSKLRFYSLSYTNHSQDAVINIDGVNYKFRQKNNTNGNNYMLDFQINGLQLKNHTVYVYTNNNVLSFAGIDIDSSGYMLSFINDNISLDKSSINIEDKETVKLDPTIKSYVFSDKDILWTSSDESVAKVDEEGNVTGVSNGNAVISGKIKDTEYKVKCNVNVRKTILKLKSDFNKINLNDTIDMYLTVDNVDKICSESAVIEYDSSKLKLLDIENEDGMKILRCKRENGKVNITLTCAEDKNAYTGYKKLAKLKFQAIGKGDTLLHVNKGAISDGVFMKRNLTNIECGQRNITIE